jgi:transketolase
MRNNFSKYLVRKAEKDNNIFIVVADISPAGKMEDFQKKFKDRFINVGVSEQSMIGLCSGLAASGKKPFAYTIATFSLYRPFEMVRDDLCYQNLPVTVVGMGAGTVYSTLGGTHLTQEDISIARSIPNMQVLVPCDPLELEKCIDYCIQNKKGPVYLRIGKSGEAIFTDKSKEKFIFGKLRNISKGSDVCIVCSGPIIKLAFELKKRFKNLSIYSAHTLKPFDYKQINKLENKYKKIITIEDHSEIGGLASIFRENIINKKKLFNFSLKDKFIHNYGDQNNLLRLHGISVQKIERVLNERN